MAVSSHPEDVLACLVGFEFVEIKTTQSDMDTSPVNLFPRGSKDILFGKLGEGELIFD